MVTRSVEILVLLLFILCSNSKKASTSSNQHNNSEKNILAKNIKNYPILKSWIEFYQDSTLNFSLDNFEFKSTDSLTVTQGSVYGSFDPEFDTIYNRFLIYNKNKTKYIDFDSYHWELDENSQLMLSPDQEINLVNLREESVNRIAFRSSSQWVENAFWYNDITIILLENNYIKQPIITQINLKEKLIQTFQFKDRLLTTSNYSKKRWSEHGLILE